MTITRRVSRARWTDFSCYVSFVDLFMLRTRLWMGAILIVLTLRFLPGGISSLWRSGWRGGAEEPSLAYADTGTDVEKAP